MPKVTNVSSRVIHVGDQMLVPSQPAEVSDDVLDNHVIKAYMDAGDIQMGEVKVRAEVEQPDDGDDDDKPKAPPRAAAPNPVQQPPKKA